MHCWGASESAARGKTDRLRMLRLVLLASLAAWGARPASAAPAGFSDCAPQLASVSGESLIVMPRTDRLVQRLPAAGNVAACSLAVQSFTYSWPVVEVVQWDPQSLQPDPTTVALRTRRSNPSQYTWFRLDHTFSPPVVTLATPGVADARSAPPALVLAHNSYYNSNPLWLRMQSDASPEVPVGLLSAAGGAYAPLPGPHAALAHTVCVGSTPVADYRIVQAVMTTDSALAPSSDEFAQRFRVPRPATLHWSEIANALNPAALPGGVVEVTLFEGGPDAPPEDLDFPLTRGVTGEIISPHAYDQDHARWIPTFDFDASVMLLPGRDYWLVIRGAQHWSMLTRVRTGGESEDFVSAIGPLLRRADAQSEWSGIANRSLAFRLIGTPSTVIGTGPAHPVVALRLQARPNPMRGELRLSWSGARGGVRVEVLDATGRRRGSIHGLVGPSGEWIWDGRLRGGGRLESGVYLVRATDAGGAVAARRVVLLR